MRALALLCVSFVLSGCGEGVANGPSAGAGGNAPVAGATSQGGGGSGAGVASGGVAGSSNASAGSAGSSQAGGGSAAGAGMGGGGTGGGPSAQPPTLKIMTFNIRYGSAPDGDNAWSLRKPLAFDVFTRQDADLVGVQEALDAQLVDIDAAVAGYARVGVGRDDGMKNGEYSAIYYRTSRFETDASGTFWFSDTPEEPGSTSWGNDIPRICTWGHFTEKATGYGFYLYNVHLDHMSQPSREKSVALLMKRASEREVAGDPFIVTGDFNAGEDNVATLFMKGEAMVDGASNPSPLVDSFRVAHPDEDEVRTAHGFNGGTTGGKIDYVYVAPGQTVLAAEIDRTEVDGRYPSDHYPVTGTFVMP